MAESRRSNGRLGCSGFVCPNEVDLQHPVVPAKNLARRRFYSWDGRSLHAQPTGSQPSRRRWVPYSVQLLEAAPSVAVGSGAIFRHQVILFWSASARANGADNDSATVPYRDPSRYKCQRGVN